MNCGLGSLTTLKALVLPLTLRTRAEWDTQLTAIGKAVAAAFERHCNRRFAYLAGDTVDVSADRSFVALPRCPVVTVSAIELRDSALGAWTSIGAPDSVLFSLAAESGLAQFGVVLGSFAQRLRLTYTGGYFFETLDSTEVGYPTAVPAGSTPLPDDLQRAWVLAVQAQMDATDLLRGAAAAPAGKTPRNPAAAPAAILTADVMEMLRPFIRYT